MAQQGKSLTSTYIKVVVLTAGIVLIMLIRSHIGDMVAFSERILSGGGEEGAVFQTAESYTEEKQEELKKIYAGFWKFSGKLPNGVKYHDLIELKDNGIIWQYQTSAFSFPYHDKDTLYRVSTSYLLPYQAKDTVSNRSECYLKLIRQNWVIDGEPCFGKSIQIIENMFQADAQKSDIIHMWDVERTSDTTLVINNLEYRKYSGDIYKFFPDAAVAAIESVDDPAVEPCSGENPHLKWVRDRIIRAIKSQPLTEDIVRFEQQQNVKNFYVPFCLNELEINYGGHNGTIVQATLTLSPEGSVTDVKLKGAAATSSPKVTEMLTAEMKEWILHGTGSEEKLEFTFTAQSYK